MASRRISSAWVYTMLFTTMRCFLAYRYHCHLCHHDDQPGEGCYKSHSGTHGTSRWGCFPALSALWWTCSTFRNQRKMQRRRTKLKTPVHVAATSLEYLSLIEISWYGLFFYLAIFIYRNSQPRPVGVIIILEMKIMPETLFAGMLFQEDAECLVL